MAVAILALAAPASSQNQVNLSFNGQPLDSDVSPIIFSGRTLVPVRVISESLGADVAWDPSEKKVTLTKNADVVTLTVDRKEVYRNGARLPDLDVPARIAGGRTMVPVRFIGEALGAMVQWDEATRTVALTFTEKRDGLSPEQLLAKSDQAMHDLRAFRYRGTLTYGEASGSGQGAGYSFEGARRQSGDRVETYLIQRPEEAGSGVGSKIENFLRGNTWFTRVDGGAWQSLGQAASAGQVIDSQDPKRSLEILSHYSAFVTHANQVRMAGKDHYVLFSRVDPDKYKRSLIQIFGAGNDSVQALIGQAQLEMSKRIFIEKDTFRVIRVITNARATLDGGAGFSLSQVIELTLEVYDFNAEVVMPEIPAR